MITATPVRTGFLQILMKSDEKLSRIADSRQQTLRRLEKSQARKAELEVQAQTRQARLDEQQRLFESINAQYEQARNYASEAMGTLGEQEALSKLKALQMVLERQQATLDRVVETARKETERDQAELTSLLASIEADTKQLAELKVQERQVQSAKQQAHADLGEYDYREIVAQHEAFLQRIATRKQAILDEQLAHARFLDESVESLQEWPGNAQAVKRLRKATTGPIRVMEAFLAFVDALVKEGRVDVSVDAMAQTVGTTSYIYDFLFLHMSDLVNSDVLRDKHEKESRLVDRLRQIEQER